MKKKNKQSGSMMVELIIAISIISVSVIVVMSVVQRTIQLTRQSLHISQATFLLEEGAEIMRILRDNSWINISDLEEDENHYPSFSGGAWSLAEVDTPIGIFSRKVTISLVSRDAGSGDISEAGDNDPGTRLITVTVSWPEGSQTLERSLSFYLMNIFSL